MYLLINNNIQTYCIQDLQVTLEISCQHHVPSTILQILNSPFKQKKMKLTFDLVSASPSRQQPWQPGPAHSCPIPRRHLPVPPSRTCPTRESPGSPPPYDPRSGPRLQYGRNNNSDNSLLRGTAMLL